MDLTTRHGGGRATATTVALLAVAVLFGGWLTIVVRRNGPADFYVYYIAASLTRNGHSFYTISRAAWDETARQAGVTHFTWPYRYPPYTAALVRLLTPLGAFGAMVAWVVVDAAALVAGAVVLGLALGGGRRVALAVGALALFGPAYHTLFDGQVNGLAFLALALGFWGLARGRDLPAGAGLALAAALKLTPLALIAYLAWRRRWRAVLAAAAVLAALTAVTLPLTGTAAFTQYVGRAYTLTDPQYVNPSAANQTSTGVLGRLFLPTSGKVIATTGTPRLVRLAALVFSAALIAATAAVTRPGRRRAIVPTTGSPGRRPARLPTPAAPRAPDDASAARVRASPEELLGYGMVLAAALVIGPFTWYHQFVWLLIPLVTLSCRFFAVGRRAALIALALLVVGMDLNELMWSGLRAGVLGSGVYRGLSLPFLAALAAWAMAAALIVRRGAPRAEAAPDAQPEPLV